MVHRKDAPCTLMGIIMIPSASASVVTQGHGGMMMLEGEGAAFIVSLPGSPPS